MSVLPSISDEQQYVVDCVKLNDNVTVLSVAGSGKTTCALHIATQLPNKRIVLITYNSKLKQETRNRALELGIMPSQFEVHNYHSFGVNYYPEMFKCYTDSGINAMLKVQPNPTKSFGFDIIIIDEAQDMNYTYFELTTKIFFDSQMKNAQIVIFGDRQQSIFKFNEADERYISMSNRVFQFSRGRQWTSVRLPTSFRLTIPQANFLNRCVLNRDPGDDHTFSIKPTITLPNTSTPIPAPKPRYIICNTFSSSNSRFSNSGKQPLVRRMSAPYDEVMRYIQMGYLPSEMMIIAPSVRSANSPVRMLENDLKTHQPQIQLFVQTDEDGRVDHEVSDGKLVFATFHQTKGLERKVILVMGMDDSYFKWFGKDSDPKLCPNTIYVALTRCKEHLSMFHHYDCGYMPFINVPLLRQYCDVIERNPLKSANITKHAPPKEMQVSVTDLVRNISMAASDECYQMLTINNIRLPCASEDVINIPGKQPQPNGRSESVREITGTFVPCLYEYIRSGSQRMPILEHMLDERFEDTFTKIEMGQRKKGEMFKLGTDATTTQPEEDEDETPHGKCMFDFEPGEQTQPDNDSDSDYEDEDAHVRFDSSEINTQFGIAFRTRLQMRAFKQTTIIKRPLLFQTQLLPDDLFDESLDGDNVDTDLVELPVDACKPFKLTEIDPLNISVEEALYICNCWTAYVSGYINPIYQIKRYDWISECAVHQCLARVESLNLPMKCEFEKRMFTSGANELIGRKLSGVVDGIDDEHIYEFKCVGALDVRHVLQLMLYMYIQNSIDEATHTNSKPTNHVIITNPFDRYKSALSKPIAPVQPYVPKIKSGYLFNILTNELVEIVNDPVQIAKAVRILFIAKYSSPPTISDADFIADVDARCRQYIARFEPNNPLTPNPTIPLLETKITRKPRSIKESTGVKGPMLTRAKRQTTSHPL